MVPWFNWVRMNALAEGSKSITSIPWWHFSQTAETPKSIHDDEDYTKKFGWLASRFRRTRWWFFVVWLVYEFIRACFYAGASGHPMTQVFGLLVVEIIAFVGIILIRPFEGQRLNALVVYLLGFSKVATLALSAAFDVKFNLTRIPTTAVGIVVIVIQGILTIFVMIAIAVGGITTYMSITRNREEVKPKRLQPIREKYFKHVDQSVKDVPPPPPPPPPPPEEPKDPYFNVNSFRRMAKIEDEDPEFMQEVSGEPTASRASLAGVQQDGVAEQPMQRSRAGSVRSQMSFTSLPQGARVHRASWNSRDFDQHQSGGRSRAASAAKQFSPEGSRPSSMLASTSRSRDALGRIPSPIPVSPAEELKVSPFGLNSPFGVSGHNESSASVSRVRPALTPIQSENVVSGSPESR